MYDTRVTKMEIENVKNMYSRNDKKRNKIWHHRDIKFYIDTQQAIYS